MTKRHIASRMKHNKKKQQLGNHFILTPSIDRKQFIVHERYPPEIWPRRSQVVWLILSQRELLDPRMVYRKKQKDGMNDTQLLWILNKQIERISMICIHGTHVSFKTLRLL